MNLTELFKIQKALDQHIEREHPRQDGEDRLAKKILSLQVELGECCNEWRGFKFWSKNQSPKPPQHNWRASEDGMNQEWLPEWGYESYPLLEEYVDCLHFILSIGLEIGEINPVINVPLYLKEPTIDKQFLLASECVLKMQYDDYYEDLINVFLGLGEMLGFTWGEVEQAYYLKNKINHARQDSGTY